MPVAGQRLKKGWQGWSFLSCFVLFYFNTKKKHLVVRDAGGKWKSQEVLWIPRRNGTAQLLLLLAKAVAALALR